MATINDSIYLQQATPDLVGSVSKAINLKSALQQQKSDALAFQKQQAIQQASKNSMVQGPDGQMQFDRNKYLQNLNNIDPTLSYEQAEKYKAQDVADQNAQIQLARAKTDQFSNLLSGITDQKSYDLAKQKAISSNWISADEAAQLPAQYDPAFIKQHQAALLPVKERLDLEAKNRGLDIEQQKATASTDLAKAKFQELGQNRQNQALQQTQTILESARGNPEVSQALRDRYAANKFTSLVNLYGDPNKLNPQQVQLAASEVAKIAQGGVPQSTELQHLIPKSIPGSLANLSQQFLNSPTPANQGAFVKAYGDYVGSLKKDADAVIKDKFGRVIETRRRQLGEQNYKNLKAQYLDPLNSGGDGKDYHAMSDDELDKAYKAAGGK